MVEEHIRCLVEESRGRVLALCGLAEVAARVQFFKVEGASGGERAADQAGLDLSSVAKALRSFFGRVSDADALPTFGKLLVRTGVRAAFLATVPASALLDPRAPRHRAPLPSAGRADQAGRHAAPPAGAGGRLHGRLRPAARPRGGVRRWRGRCRRTTLARSNSDAAGRGVTVAQSCYIWIRGSCAAALVQTNGFTCFESARAHSAHIPADQGSPLEVPKMPWMEPKLMRQKSKRHVTSMPAPRASTITRHKE